MGVFLSAQLGYSQPRKLSHSALIVLMAVTKFIDDYSSDTDVNQQTGKLKKVGYTSYTSKRKVHKDSGLSEVSVHKGYKELKKMGLIVELEKSDPYYKDSKQLSYALNVSMLVRIADYHVTCEQYGIDKEDSDDAQAFYDLATTFLEHDMTFPLVDDFRTIYKGKAIPNWKQCVEERIIPEQWIPEAVAASAINDSITDDDLSRATNFKYAFPHKMRTEKPAGQDGWTTYSIGVDELDEDTGTFSIAKSPSLTPQEIERWYQDNSEEMLKLKSELSDINNNWSHVILQAIQDKKRDAKRERRRILDHENNSDN